MKSPITFSQKLKFVIFVSFSAHISIAVFADLSGNSPNVGHPKRVSFSPSLVVSLFLSPKSGKWLGFSDFEGRLPLYIESGGILIRRECLFWGCLHLPLSFQCRWNWGRLKTYALESTSCFCAWPIDYHIFLSCFQFQCDKLPAKQRERERNWCHGKQ